MTTPVYVSTDPVDTSNAMSSQSMASYPKMSFADTLTGALGYSAAVGGPLAYELSGSNVVGATMQATAYSGGYSPYSVGGTGFSTTGSGYGYGGVGYSGSGSSATDMMTMAQEQLAASQEQSMALLMIQDQQGSQVRMYTAASNMLATRQNLDASLIRNNLING